MTSPSRFHQILQNIISCVRFIATFPFSYLVDGILGFVLGLGVFVCFFLLETGFITFSY